MAKHKLTPLRAIKEYCKEQCCAGDTKSWRDCLMLSCPLWNYRFGRSSKKKIEVLHKKNSRELKGEDTNGQEKNKRAD